MRRSGGKVAGSPCRSLPARTRIAQERCGLRLLINELRDLAILVARLPRVTRCVDPYDNYLLAMAEFGAADFLVTGDKRDLLGIGSHESTRIMTVRDFLTLIGKLP